MSHIQRFSATVTTDVSGDATDYAGPVNGFLEQVRYVKDDFANGVDFTITSEDTGETLWSESNVDASATRAPRQASHGTDGAASLFAAGGTAVTDKIAVSGRIKIVIAAGGDTKSGTFHFTTS